MPDQALEGGEVELAVGVAEGAVLGEGVEVLERQLHGEALQRLEPVADLLVVERAAAVGVDHEEELLDLVGEVEGGVEVRERGEERVEGRLELLRRDEVVLELELLEPLALLAHGQHELVEQDGVDHPEEAHAAHEVEEDEEERHPPVHHGHVGAGAARGRAIGSA